MIEKKNKKTQLKFNEERFAMRDMSKKYSTRVLP